MRIVLALVFAMSGCSSAPTSCAAVQCAAGMVCGFQSTTAQCFTPCPADGGACAGGASCGCAGSCPGCENCLMVCTP